MIRKKIYSVLKFLFAIYLANRISFYSIGVFSPITYYPYNANFMDGVMSGNNIGDLGWIWLVPFHPYLIIGLLPIITLNLVILCFYFRITKSAESIKKRYNKYFILIIPVYILSIIIFIVLSYLNNFEDHVVCDKCLYEIFLEIYIPYSPHMICGFLVSQIIFGFLWVGVIEKYLWKSKGLKS